jgi:hypothetical protein
MGIASDVGCNWLRYSFNLPLNTGDDCMGSFSVWHWLITLLYIGAFVVPCWRIVNKAGYAGAWSLLAVVPLLNIVLLWVFAFMRWPNERQSS